MYENPYQTPQSGQGGQETYGAVGVSPGVQRELLGTKPWVRFVSVMLFIGSGFMIVAGLIALFTLGSLAGVMGIVVALIYLVMGAIYLIPALKLWGYGSAIQECAMTNSPASLEKAISQQRQFWKFVGIMIIAGFVLGIILAVLTASMASRMRSSLEDGSMQSEFQRSFQKELQESMRKAQEAQGQQ